MGQPMNICNRYLEKEIWTEAFRYSWRKMEMAAHRAGNRQMVCDQ